VSSSPVARMERSAIRGGHSFPQSASWQALTCVGTRSGPRRRGRLHCHFALTAMVYLSPGLPKLGFASQRQSDLPLKGGGGGDVGAFAVVGWVERMRNPSRRLPLQRVQMMGFGAFGASTHPTTVSHTGYDTAPACAGKPQPGHPRFSSRTVRSGPAAAPTETGNRRRQRRTRQARYRG
jgi:hypothetical protein